MYINIIMNSIKIFDTYLPTNLYFKHDSIQIESVYQNVMYLCDDKVECNYEDSIYEPNIIAYIKFYVDDTTDCADINTVHVKENYRGRGYSLFLLLKTIVYLASINIDSVQLDDTSDKYRQEHNLYKLVGFKYIADYGAEMTAEIDELLNSNNFGKFISKAQTVWKKYYTTN